MRAMSLAADDGNESEQNDLRTLQVQLDSTKELITKLSSQMKELQNQVSWHPGCRELAREVECCTLWKSEPTRSMQG